MSIMTPCTFFIIPMSMSCDFGVLRCPRTANNGHTFSEAEAKSFGVLKEKVVDYRFEQEIIVILKQLDFVIRFTKFLF